MPKTQNQILKDIAVKLGATPGKNDNDTNELLSVIKDAIPEAGSSSGGGLYAHNYVLGLTINGDNSTYKFWCTLYSSKPEYILSEFYDDSITYSINFNEQDIPALWDRIGINTINGYLFVENADTHYHPASLCYYADTKGLYLTSSYNEGKRITITGIRFYKNTDTVSIKEV